ncbi:MAG: hypothetical protein JW876_11935 [Candidatus Krumholzibacteriota bacterium]|nr:hypothetical protein [Candidatus Krumholzibacteriota bacterium]
MKGILVSLFALLFLAGAAEAAFWNVYPDGSGVCPTIQSALDSAAASGDFISIEGGVYHEENLSVAGKDVFLSFNGGNVYVTAPTPGSGTGITIAGASPAFNLFGISFVGFATGVAIEDGSPAVSYANIRECGTGIAVSGASSAPDLSFNFIDSCAVGIEAAGGMLVDVGNHTIVDCETGVRVAGAAAVVQRSIVYGCDTGIDLASGTVAIDCSDFWMNGVDAAGVSLPPTNIHELPRFCFVAYPQAPFFLHVDSPCWSANNDCGVNMGAFTVTWGCEGTAVRETTWSGIKSLYR